MLREVYAMHEKAYRSVLRLIAQRDYSEFELKEKMQKKYRLSDQEWEKIANDLKEKGLIDDQRYLKDRIEAHFYQYRGHRRIIEDLRKRGFTRSEVEDALAEYDPDAEVERASIRAEAFLKRRQSGSRYERQEKLKAHLLRQGFEYATIMKVLETVEDDYPQDEERNSLRRLLSRRYQRDARRYEGYELRQRLMRYAASKGYPYDMIDEVIKEIENEN